MNFSRFSTVLILISVVFFFIFLFHCKTYFYKNILFYDNCIRAVHSSFLVVIALIFNKKLNTYNIVKLEFNPFGGLRFIFFPSMLVLIYFFLNTKFENLKTINTSDIFLLFLATFLAASAEEFVFRFFCSNFLLNRGFDLKKTAILTSLLFAFSHLNNIRYANNWASPLNQISIAFFIGLLFASIIFITQKFLITSVLHFLINSPDAINDLVNENENVTANFNFSSNLSSVLLVHLMFAPMIIMALHSYKKIK